MTPLAAKTACQGARVVTVKDLTRQLEAAPPDAEVVALDDSVQPNQVVKPQVVWWSDDRKTAYLGKV